MATTEDPQLPDPIQYFVFLKAGTTGQPWQDKTRTKLVELCLTAVHREDLATGEPKKMPASLKLNITFFPERKIQEEATEKHGLTDNYVQNSLRFKQCAGLIVKFLKSLPKPVCLVAHNGFSFDFKFLKEEFIVLGITLPEDLLCADSTYIFGHILKKENKVEKPHKFKGLMKLHQLFFEESHDTAAPKNAEEHVIMLLECVLLNKTFAEFADRKSKLFTEVRLVGEKSENYKKRAKRVKVKGEDGLKKIKKEEDVE